MGLGFVDVLKSMITLYITLILLGYLICLHAKLGFSQTPFFVKFPLILSLGFTTLIPTLFFIGLFFISSLTIPAIWVISISFILTKTRTIPFKKIMNSADNSVQNIIPLILFILVNSYFIFTLIEAEWPPPGDIMSGTGPLVSLILYNNRLPFSSNPILILYPPGFHLTTATFTRLWNFYPAHSIFVLGAIIAVLIPLIVYSLTFVLTGSVTYSILGFSSVFWICSDNLEQFMLGYFYNGVFPCFAAFLMLLMYAIIFGFFTLNLQKKTLQNFRAFLIVSILTFTALLLEYPPFSIIILLNLLIVLMIKRNEISKFVKGFFKSFFPHKWFAVLLVLAFPTLLFCLFKAYQDEINIAFQYLTATYVPSDGRSLNKTSQAYLLSPESLSDVNGILMVIGIIVAFYLLYIKKNTEFSLFYLILALPLSISFLKDLSLVLIILLPKRLLVLVGFLSLLLIFRMLVIISSTTENICKHAKLLSYLFSRKVIPLSLIVMMTLVSFSLYLSFETNRKWLWFSVHQEDFKALEWINANTTIYDHILNDATFTSEFANSMSIKNLTYSYYSWVTCRNRTVALLDIWKEPFDAIKMFNLLQEYNISYIFMTSESNQLIWDPDFSYKYVCKPYSPKLYAETFDKYPFLKIMYKDGFTRIYKVEKTNLKLHLVQTITIERASEYWVNSRAWGSNGSIGTPILSNKDSSILIPTGQFVAFGIDHAFEKTEDWSDFDFLRLTVYASDELCLSLILADSNGANVRYDFIIPERKEVGITIPFEDASLFINATSINKIELNTGWAGPFPKPGCIITVRSLELYKFSSNPNMQG